MSSESLSFTLRMAVNHEDLLKACLVRAQGYGHHLPPMSVSLLTPDGHDLDPASAVLLCEDKLTGSPVGTARIQLTTRGGPVPIEQCIELPAHMRTKGRAEITRLASVPGADRRVKLALWKAGYLYCHANQARWLLIGARSEALVRQYGRLGATDIYEDRRYVPLDYAGGLPHRVLAFDVIDAERRWFHERNPLHGFMFNTLHRDIQLFSAAPAERRVAEREALREANGAVA